MSNKKPKFRRELVNATLSDVTFDKVIANEVLAQRLGIANPSNVSLTSCLDYLISTDDNCYLIPLCFLMSRVRAHSAEGIEHAAIVGNDRLYCPRLQVPEAVFKAVKAFMQLATDIHPISQFDFWFSGVLQLKSHIVQMPNDMYRLFIASGDNLCLVDAGTGQAIDVNLGQILHQLKDDYEVTAADFGFIHNVLCIKILKSDDNADDIKNDEGSLTI